jgi:nucleotide-binding universal stress UspA family protein
MKRIIAAVDLSEPSLRAVDYAAGLAATYGAELVLLTVGQDVSEPDPGMDAFARTEHLHEPTTTLHIESLRDTLALARDRAVAKGAPSVVLDVLVGDAAEQIVAGAEGWQADLIAMGSRGHGPIAGLLLGSVTQKVIGHAHCPVLVVH